MIDRQATLEAYEILRKALGTAKSVDELTQEDKARLLLLSVIRRYYGACDIQEQFIIALAIRHFEITSGIPFDGSTVTYLVGPDNEGAN